MRLIIIFLVLTVFVLPPSITSAQMQGTHGRTYKVHRGLMRDVNLMTGMMTDIDRILSSGSLTFKQHRRVMNIMAELGGIMKEIGSAKEIEGWKLAQQARKLNEMRMRLDALKMEILRK